MKKQKITVYELNPEEENSFFKITQQHYDVSIPHKKLE